MLYNLQRRDYSHSMKILSLIIILSWAPVAFGVEAEHPETYVSAKTIRENASRVNLKLRSHAALVFDERDNGDARCRSGHG